MLKSTIQFNSLPIPNKLNKLVRGEAFVKVHRGEYTDKEYSIYLLYISYGHQVETHFGRGWEVFMDENEILVKDKHEITYEGDNNFHVTVFRDGVEVPRANDSDVIVLSNSTCSDYIGSLSNGTTNDGTDPDEDGEDYLEFRAKFTQPYIKMGRLNVPLAFARSQLETLGPRTKVKVWINKKYPAYLHVKRDERDKIRLCNIKEGISSMIHDQNIVNGEEVVVQMICKYPPTFKVTKASEFV